MKRQAAMPIKAAERIRKRKQLIGANNIPNNRTRRTGLTTSSSTRIRLGTIPSSSYPGQNFDDVEDDIALGYEQAKPGSALPWDTVRPAVNAVWDYCMGRTAMPQGPSPTLIRRNSLRDFTSTRETSFEAPFAV